MKKKITKQIAMVLLISGVMTSALADDEVQMTKSQVMVEELLYVYVPCRTGVTPEEITIHDFKDFFYGMHNDELAFGNTLTERLFDTIDGIVERRHDLFGTYAILGLDSGYHKRKEYYDSYLADQIAAGSCEE